ncbi:MAG: site-2 protease family protein [Clostridia bacterium]|nr:site-2 protease family protein [Clostridia bacterium]
MGGIKLSVHPLFFLFGLYFALTGRIFLFLICTFTAVVHEIGHSIVASKYGYRLNNVVLMPFGAVVKGNLNGLKFSDQFKVAFAGPLVNLAVGIFFTATWWLFPITYSFTDTVAYANFSMALINLIPAYPLDGGRILYSMIAEHKTPKLARNVCVLLGLIFGVSLLGLFVFSIFKNLNLSLLFFSLFIIFGTFTKPERVGYVKIYGSLSEEKLLRGAVIKRQALSGNATVKKMLSILDEQSLNEIVVYVDGKALSVLNQEKINKIIENGNIYAKISEYLSVSTLEK